MSIILDGTNGIDTPDVLTNSPLGMGYTTGAGGTVTQLTSKSTNVTLNKPAGQITMNNAALAAGASVTFTCTNSTVTNSDVVVANVSSSGLLPSYTVRARTDSGTIGFLLKNETAGSLSDAVVINFAIIKGATS